MKLYSRKRKNPIKVLIALSLLAGLAFAISKQFMNHNINDIVVAQIENENIYKSEVERKLSEVFSNNPNSKVSFDKLPDQVIELIAREIFLDKKIIAEAKKNGLDNDSEVKDAIENFKTNILRQTYINRELKDSITEQRIVEKFNEINSELESKVEYKYYQIVVKENSQAESIYKSLKAKKKPAKFLDLVKKHAVDSEANNPQVNNVNDGEFKTESSIQKPVLEVLKTLKKDEISKPFEVDNLWYVVKFIEVKKAKPIEFDSAKEYIRHLVKAEEVEKINNRFIKDNKVKLLIKKEAENSSKESSKEGSTNSSLEKPAEQTIDGTEDKSKIIDSNDSSAQKPEGADIKDNQKTNPDKSMESPNQKQVPIEESSQKL